MMVKMMMLKRIAMFRMLILLNLEPALYNLFSNKAENAVQHRLLAELKRLKIFKLQWLKMFHAELNLLQMRSRFLDWKMKTNTNYKRYSLKKDRKAKFKKKENDYLP